jgi:hypothetical protein
MPELTGSLKQVATIASGASLSNGLALQNNRAIAIQMPSSWTAANLTFQGSYDGNTWDNVYDDSGTEVTVTAAASRYIILDPSVFAGIEYLKIRSGTSGSAVNQGAARELNVVIGKVLG